MIEALRKLVSGRDAVADTFRVIDALRESVAEAKARLARIEAAPVPPAEALAALSAWIDAKATVGVDRLGLDHVLEPGRAAQGIRLPVMLTRTEGGAVPDTSAAIDALFGLVLAVNRDAVLHLVKGQLADLAEGRDVIPAAERHARIEAARADVLSAELHEEAACRALERLGIEVARRGDADPRALLASDACMPG